MYLGDFGMCAAAVSSAGVHPDALGRCALLSQRTLLLLDAPATVEARICFQTHSAAVPHGVTLVQVR